MSVEPGVAGERTVASARGGRSFSVRMQRALVIGLVCGIGAMVLAWYYLKLGADARVPASAAAARTRSAAASEMKLPALIRQAAPAIRDPSPGPAAPTIQPETSIGATGNVGDPPAAQGRAAPVETPPAHLRSSSPVLLRAPALVAPPPPAGLAELALLARAAGAAEAGSSSPGSTAATPPASGLAAPVAASVLPTRRWLLPKGSSLDCTLETAIDSTLAGLTTCLLATDIFGADGRVVLLERGTQLVGETRSEIRAGQSRVAILWNEARTPTGVVVGIGSPGTDALGRAGIPGAVDAHFGTRFGAAIMLSLIDGAVSDVAAHRSGTGLVVYGTQGTHEIATEALRNTINVPPTIRVAAGARVQVLVARDLDFRGVYRLSERGDP